MEVFIFNCYNYTVFNNHDTLLRNKFSIYLNFGIIITINHNQMFDQD